MTRGACDGRTSGTAHPLAATLARVSAASEADGGMDFSARLGVPDGPGWMTVADFAGDPGLLGEIMAQIGRGFGTEDRAFLGTTLLRSYLWRMLTPAIAVLLAERRLPDLRVANVALSFGEDGYATGLAFVGPRLFVLPDDPDAGHPDAVVLASEDDLLRFMRDALAETHLPVMISALGDLRVRRGTRVLWRAGADVCAEAFMFVGRDLGREAVGMGSAEKLLSVPSPLYAPINYRVLEYPGGSEATCVRNTCCLYYKLGNRACFTCPRTSDEERIRRLLQENATLEIEDS